MWGGQATEDGKRCLSSEQIPLIRSQDGLGKWGVFHPDQKGAPKSLSTRVTHQVYMFFKHQSCLYNNAQPLPICSGCHDQPSQTGRLNHRASLVCSPRGWKSKITVFAGVVSPGWAHAPPVGSSHGLPSARACPEALVWTDKDFLQGHPLDWTVAHPTSLLLTEAPPQGSVSKYDMGARASTNDIGHSAACNTPHTKKIFFPKVTWSHLTPGADTEQILLSRLSDEETDQRDAGGSEGTPELWLHMSIPLVSSPVEGSVCCEGCATGSVHTRRSSSTGPRRPTPHPQKKALWLWDIWF